MGGGGGRSGTTPNNNVGVFPSSSPFEPSVNAPAFVPSTSRSTPTPDSLVGRVQGLSMKGLGRGQTTESAKANFTFTATSVNTNGHLPPPPAPEPERYEEETNGWFGYYDQEDYPSGSQYEESEAVAVPTYSGPPAHLAHYRPRGQDAAFFASDEVKMTLLSRHHHRLEALNPDLASLNIPTEVEGYTNLVPLETVPKVGGLPERPGFFMSHPSTVYKALSTKDGLTYTLRRVHNCRLLNTKCMSMVELWKKLQHPNIVSVRHAFSTKAFNDYSLVFVYDYHGGAETLKSRHFSGLNTVASLQNTSTASDTSQLSRPPPTHGGAPSGRKPSGLEEGVVWSYIIQLTSAIRAIHATGVAASTIDPSKLLITGRCKLLINCCGITDVLSFEINQVNLPAAISHFQQDDLIALGRLVVALCCGSLASAARDNLPAAMQYITQFYSADMKNLASFLLTTPQPGRPKNVNEVMPMIGARFFTELDAAQGRQDMLQNELAKEIDNGRLFRGGGETTPQPGRPKNVNEVMPMIGARFFTELDAAQRRQDMFQNELAKEIDNGRLFRLICKLSTVTERADHAMDPAWSETGDRYLLKLFRDFLFHQVTSEGRPWLSLGHVVSSLNKLDAGTSEKVLLSSRDERSVLLVSYADIRRCLDTAFSELHNAAPLHLPTEPSEKGLV